MKRGEFPEEKMKDAVHDVIENQRSTRSVAKDFETDAQLVVM